MNSSKETEKIQNQILELKIKHPLSDKDKLKLQKLQQKLEGETNS